MPKLTGKRQAQDVRTRILQGLQLEQQHRLDEAAQLYAGVLAADPHNFYALYRSAIISAERGDNVGALRLIQAAMKKSITADVATDCALILERLGRFAEAAETYDRALILKPNDPATLLKRAKILVTLGQHAKALASLDRLLTYVPDHAEAHSLRGTALVNLARYREAIVSLNRASTLDPQNAETHFHRALTLLTLGDFDAGWSEYEWRFRVEGLAASRSIYPQPHWDGVELLAGKIILLYTEQGLGDSIMFCRYAPMLAARGAAVIVGILRPAKVLIAEMQGVTALAPGDPLPAFDLQCPLLSLPYLLKTRIDTVPADVPYLRPRPDRIDAWQGRVPHDRTLTAGVVWAGGRDFKGDRARTVGLRLFETLFACPGIRFVSLQRDLREGDAERLRALPDVVHFGEALADFGDTAAVIGSLDLVISVDTAVAHLAGAIGKPVWILLPAVPDFRWMLERTDSPWYPTARLFRQPALDDWGSVMKAVRTALSGLVEARRAPSV